MAAISDAQRAVLAKLAPLLGHDYYLVGGTSRDLDLFTPRDPTELQSRLEGIAGLTIDARSGKTLHLRVDGIPVSLIAYAYPLLEPAVPEDRLPVDVASVTDLACMKLSAIANRGAARDFWDLHTILQKTGHSLSTYLGEYRRKYPVEDVGHVLRALAYFGDAEAAPLPEALSAESWERITHDFEQWVRELATA